MTTRAGDGAANPDTGSVRKLSWALVAATALILAWQFRYFWLSGLNRQGGDIADTRIEIAFMEHWLSALRGYEGWPSANFFYPWPGVMGFTDAFLLFSVPYGFVRALGADVYLAHEMLHMILRTMGCIGAALVLFRIGRLPWWIAAFGGVLFVLQNASAAHVGHTQMQGFFFFPWIVLTVHTGFTTQRTWLRMLAWLIAGGLIGSLLLTSFTVSWYSSAIFCTGLLVYALLVALVPSLRPERAVLRARWRAFFPAALPGLLLIAIGLVQFVRLYLPQSRRYGGFSFDGIEASLITPRNWFAVGEANYMWGWLQRIWGVADYETTASLTPVLFLTMLIGGLVLVLRRDTPRRWWFVVLLCLVAASLWLFLITRFGSFNLWRYVNEYAPGGRGLRALGRAQFVLPLLAVPIACIVLGSLARRGRTATAALLGLLLLVEQGNRGMHTLYRKEELAILASIPPTPRACSVFYVTHAPAREHYPEPNFISHGYGPATDAMLVAQRDHVPTANGVSTWSPPGWGPFRVDDPGYVEGMRNWLRTNGITRGVCELDLATRSWQKLGDL
ncbi:hypothetical protein [Roseiterribacter gracilis]|uniref:Uncharacterized protein n=1 Tax=Roseiterribacter gracilis TaxID=2812848 RepID=A0A8S8XJS5_9PROT|nr:hypothetical protein TMPK1_32670 [Rhodospirillales bacterium TMPK1]